MILQLADSEEATSTEGCRLEENRYYRPKYSNFLLIIDSLLLIHPPGEPSPMLMLRIARNGEPHMGDLHKIDDLQFSPDTCRYYVMVTPEGVYPETTAPMEHFGIKVNRRSRLTGLRMKRCWPMRLEMERYLLRGMPGISLHLQRSQIKQSNRA